MLEMTTTTTREMVIFNNTEWDDNTGTGAHSLSPPNTNMRLQSPDCGSILYYLWDRSIKGRNLESAGEDPYLSGEYVRPRVTLMTHPLRYWVTRELDIGVGTTHQCPLGAGSKLPHVC